LEYQKEKDKREWEVRGKDISVQKEVQLHELHELEKEVELRKLERETRELDQKVILEIMAAPKARQREALHCARI
jgi:adenine-specific DNA methylase